MTSFDMPTITRNEMQTPEKSEMLNTLTQTQTEVDALELHLEYDDLIWRKSPNAPSIQELFEHIVDAEQRLLQDLLPLSLHNSQQKIVWEWYRIRHSQLDAMDSEQRIFRQLSTVRRITLILLEAFDESVWLKQIERCAGVITIGCRVRQFVDENRVYMSGVKRLLEERCALTSRGAIWN